MPKSRNLRKTPKQGAAPQPPAGLEEEIRRIQSFLRVLDKLVDGQTDVTLKDLAQAVRTACEGGRSIAWLRRVGAEMEQAVQDADTERLRAHLSDLLASIGNQLDEGEAGEVRL